MPEEKPGIIFRPEFEGKEIEHKGEQVLIQKAFSKEGNESVVVLIVQSGPINEVWGRIDIDIEELHALV